ncbi:MAG: hypothetical protein QOJ67_1776, partial [Acidimicrobiaceae bacterium]
ASPARAGTTVENVLTLSASRDSG